MWKACSLLLLSLSVLFWNQQCEAWVASHVATAKSSALVHGSSCSRLAASFSSPPPAAATLDSSTTTTTVETIAPPGSTKKTPTVDWDWKNVASYVFEESAKPILLFDGICNFCNGGVNLCLDWDEDAHFRYASLQSKVGQSLLIQHGKQPDDISSLVLVYDNDTAYFHSDAVMGVAEQLKGLPWIVRSATKLSRAVLPASLRDGAYQFVSQNRHLFGQADGPTCRLDFDGNLQQRFIKDPIDDGDDEV